MWVGFRKSNQVWGIGLGLVTLEAVASLRPQGKGWEWPAGTQGKSRGAMEKSEPQIKPWKDLELFNCTNINHGGSGYIKRLFWQLYIAQK